MVIQAVGEERPLRADAVRNREKILEAAAIVFADRGLEATLDEVAAQAGVGVGTVYRRFPDKDALIIELFRNAVDEIATLAMSAYESENSWDGLVWFLEEVLERQCEDRGLRDVLLGAPQTQYLVDEAKCKISPAIHNLVTRAKKDGYLRDDVVDADFPIFEMMISSFGCMTYQFSPDLWRRYLTILLDGLRTRRDAPSKLHQFPTDELATMAIKGLSRRPRRTA